MRYNFRVRFGDEAMVAFAQAVFQLQVVFDDAVVDNDYATRAVAVWVRILFRRTPMRSPARVAYAVSAVQWIQPYRFLEIAKLSFGSTNLKVVLFINHRDASRIVAAIFQLSQPLNNDGHYLFIANVTNNATHVRAGMRAEK